MFSLFLKVILLTSEIRCPERPNTAIRELSNPERPGSEPSRYPIIQLNMNRLNRIEKGEDVEAVGLKLHASPVSIDTAIWETDDRLFSSNNQMIEAGHLTQIPRALLLQNFQNKNLCIASGVVQSILIDSAQIRRCQCYHTASVETDKADCTHGP